MFESSMFLDPMAVLPNEGVGKNDKLAHDDSRGKPGFFSCGAQPFVEGVEVLIAGGGGGGHKKRAPDIGAAAADAA